MSGDRRIFVWSTDGEGGLLAALAGAGVMGSGVSCGGWTCGGS
jgi:hypothetical protein